MFFTIHLFCLRTNGTKFLDFQGDKKSVQITVNFIPGRFGLTAGWVVL